MAAEMSGGRRIMVREAQIKTATVEIRALTINGRQVTQSLFWQLEKEDLIDGMTLALCGDPWGRVNYFRPPCKDDHLHIVWQLGAELRRACVHERGYRDCYEWSETRFEAEGQVGDLRGWQLVRNDMPSEGSGRPATYHAPGCYFRYMDGERYASYEGPELVYTLPDWAAHARRYGTSSRQQEIDAHVQRMTERYGTPGGLEAAIRDNVLAMNKVEEQWARRWTELCDLDQLFIAV